MFVFRFISVFMYLMCLSVVVVVSAVKFSASGALVLYLSLYISVLSMLMFFCVVVMCV